MVEADTGFRWRASWLFRRWKAAAGPLAGKYIPAAPFTALALFGEALEPSFPDGALASLDAICQGLAERLAITDQAAQVQAGEAALVVDLPGALAVGLGYHLQKAGIAPVLAWGGLHRPAGLLEGRSGLAAIGYYGARLQKWQAAEGLAFLLERERSGPANLDDLRLFNTFDNRYHAGELLFPPLAGLKANGLQALIDLRMENDPLPDDLDHFYRQAAKADLNIYQAFLPAEWLTEEM